MKFIFSFLFGCIFLLPAFGSVTENCYIYSDNTTACTNAGGCEFAEGECSQCQSGWFSLPGADECTQCENGFNNGWSTQHKQHPYGASSCSDWECETGYFQYGNYCIACDPTTLPNFAIYPESISNCDNWICDVGYYRGGTNNDECKPCPNNASNCTTTGLGYQDVTCTNSYTAVTHPDHTVTCESCTDSHAINDGGTCKCAVGYYGVPAGLDTECHQCPNFASTDDINSQSINDCHCRGDYGQYPAENPTVTGDFVCTKCDTNATVDSASKQCTCKTNYYGDGLTCEKCPAGTTKSASGSVNQPSTKSACHFNSDTKFCIPNTVRTTDNSGYVCFTPTNITYTY